MLTTNNSQQVNSRNNLPHGIEFKTHIGREMNDKYMINTPLATYMTIYHFDVYCTNNIVSIDEG